MFGYLAYASFQTLRMYRAHWHYRDQTDHSASANSEAQAGSREASIESINSIAARHSFSSKQSHALVPNGGRNGAPNLVRAGRDYGAMGHGRSYDSNLRPRKKFPEFFPRAGKIYKVDNSSGRL
jgi:hypothetical protein